MTHNESSERARRPQRSRRHVRRYAATLDVQFQVRVVGESADEVHSFRGELLQSVFAVVRQKERQKRHRVTLVEVI